MIITPNLHFQGECKEALKLYEKAFKGEITILLHYSDADPADFSIGQLSVEEKEYVYHAEMIIGSQRFIFSDSLQEISQGQNISIVVTFNCADEVTAAYELLVEGGVVVHPLQVTTYSSCFVSLVDRFGMRWELMTENNS